MQHCLIQIYSFQLILSRHLTIPHFLESCGLEVLFKRYYITEEALRFKKSQKKKLAGRNPSILHTPKNCYLYRLCNLIQTYLVNLF